MFEKFRRPPLNDSFIRNVAVLSAGFRRSALHDTVNTDGLNVGKMDFYPNLFLYGRKRLSAFIIWPPTLCNKRFKQNSVYV